MKTIKGINEKPQHFNAETPKEVTDLLPTYKRLVLDVLGLSKANSGAEAIEIFTLGQIVAKHAGDDLPLEDAQYKLLMEKADANPAGLSANYFAQLLIKLKSATGE